MIKKMYIALKENKIWDKCSELQYKRVIDSLDDSEYFKTNEKDTVVGDRWNFNEGISLKDSVLRVVVVEKSLEQRIKDVETILGI